MMRGLLATVVIVAASAVAHSLAATPLFVDDFEKHTVGQLPGAPWKEETYRSGAVIVVDTRHAFSGKQAMHVFTPRGAQYRRGYMAIHLRQSLPQLQSGMFGRVMVWLDAAPVAVQGEGDGGKSPALPAPVHWTLLQGEGRSADDRYNSIYRLGLEEQGGTQLMANFETTPPVRTDCREQSALTMSTGQWTCVEWHFEAASHELEFWIDGRRITHVKERAHGANACHGDDLGGQWRAPPRFDSLYMGFERYGDTSNDQDLWIDDVVLSTQRVTCPAAR